MIRGSSGRLLRCQDGDRALSTGRASIEATGALRLDEPLITWKARPDFEIGQARRRTPLERPKPAPGGPSGGGVDDGGA
jgi:hypothetical protein